MGLEALTIDLVCETANQEILSQLRWKTRRTLEAVFQLHMSSMAATCTHAHTHTLAHTHTERLKTKAKARHTCVSRCWFRTEQRQEIRTWMLAQRSLEALFFTTLISQNHAVSSSCHLVLSLLRWSVSWFRFRMSCEP